MKRNKIFYYSILSMFVVEVMFLQSVKAQDHSKAYAAADTSRFSVNSKDGWKLFNSYVAGYKKDSATLELIIEHTNNINWTKEQYVGKIKYQPFHPAKEQIVSFGLLTNEYVMRIENTGKCYLRLKNGALPSANPFIFPLKLFYKL
jgi:hypothetical protein